MGLIRSFALAGTGIAVACLLLLGIAFITGISMSVPGTVAAESAVTGPPSAQLTVGPGLVPVLLVLTALIEIPGRLRARRALAGPERTPEPAGPGGS